MERIGFMSGEISVPDDFDAIDVVSLFEGDPEGVSVVTLSPFCTFDFVDTERRR